MPHTLVTSVDDCVIRNPMYSEWGFGVENTLDTLARHTLMGHPILIDSPFFIHNLLLRKMITDQGENLLKLMLRHRRIFIITETGGIVSDQQAKAARGEDMAGTLAQAFPDLNAEFYAAEGWLSHLPSSPYIIMPKSEHYVAERMRRSLINDILNVRRPSDLHFTMDQRRFDSFRQKLRLNLRTKTPRSSCELAFDTRETTHDAISAKKQIMSYANEAFYISMAAYFADIHKMDIIVETAYSDRFSNKIPYAKSYIPHSTNVKVPLFPILHNRNAIVEKLFGDTRIAEIREQYIYDPVNIDKANTYQTELNGILAPLNLKRSAEIAVGIGVATIPPLAAILLEKRKKMTRREVLGMTGAALGLTIGANLLSTLSPGITGDIVGMVTVEDIEKISDKEAALVELARRLPTAAPSKYVESFAENMHSAAMTKLRIDIKSDQYLKWKASAAITKI